MSWLASHQGPGGILGRSEHSDWVDAANWLRAMMEVSYPPGIEALMRELAAATTGTSYIGRTGQHYYQIAPGSA